LELRNELFHEHETARLQVNAAPPVPRPRESEPRRGAAPRGKTGRRGISGSRGLQGAWRVLRGAFGVGEMGKERASVEYDDAAEGSLEGCVDYRTTMCGRTSPCSRTFVPKWGETGGMGTDAAELLARAPALPGAARAALADSLIESLDGPVDEDAEQAWRHEVTCRLRELDSGAVQTVAWDDVRRQLRNRSRA